MARPPKVRDANKLRPRPRDLFGQVPITRTDLEDWVRAVAPHLAHSDWRMAHYIKGYNVADKVRAAKLEGTFFQLIEDRAPRVDRCSSCGTRYQR